MMKYLALFLCALTMPVVAQEDRVELDTTIIKGNTELPRILYVVPWKDLDGKSSNQQKLILHSLFGDLFDPVSPIAPDSTIQTTTSSEIKTDIGGK